jgi:hypothetical protein
VATIECPVPVGWPVRFGQTRLIDNVRVDLAAAHG